MTSPVPQSDPRSADTTLMYAEASESPAVVARQLRANASLVEELGLRLRKRPPRALITCARGSSDHAATYARYLIETRAHVLTSSASPSVSSLYGIEQDLRDCVFVAVSQSGRSPDLLASVEAARRSGAYVVTLCNVPESPLATMADFAIPLHAGPERSVAATKSYIASLAAFAHLVAAWTQNVPLTEGLQALPDAISRAWFLDWRGALPMLVAAEHLYVIARGIGLGLAQEGALKAKETAGLHAEAYSGAEVRHGPVALLGERFPALVLAQSDAVLPGLEELATELAARGVEVALAGGRAPGAIVLPTVECLAALTPITSAVSLYRLLAQVAVARGRNPDAPPYLSKITATV